MKHLDAHNHLHDARLAALRGNLDALPVAGAIVNGTRENDWPAVAALAREHGWVRAAYGLHPWYIAERTPDWEARLRAFLDADPRASVGEIGLDRWVKGHDLAQQITVFDRQLALAAERDLPMTVHCLQAWGALWESLRGHPRPFLLHAYGGPEEMVRGFLERGAYFSFSPYFLHARKAPQRAIFVALPADRLLVETDAPDLRPPDERNAHPLRDPAGEPVNHPANIAVAYAGLAEIRGLEIEALADLVAENFARLFGA